MLGLGACERVGVAVVRLGLAMPVRVCERVDVWLGVSKPEPVMVPVRVLLRVSIWEGVSVWLLVAICVNDRLRVQVLEDVALCDRVCVMLRVDVDEREDRSENV